jgi:hypothetical protein
METKNECENKKVFGAAKLANGEKTRKNTNKLEIWQTNTWMIFCKQVFFYEKFIEYQKSFVYIFFRKFSVSSILIFHYNHSNFRLLLLIVHWTAITDNHPQEKSHFLSLPSIL